MCEAREKGREWDWEEEGSNRFGEKVREIRAIGSDVKQESGNG